MLSSRSEPTDEELDEYNGPFVDSDIDDLE
jgi:hypothetical protein